MRSSLVPLFFPEAAAVLGAVALGWRLSLGAFSRLALILARAFVSRQTGIGHTLGALLPQAPEPATSVNLGVGWMKAEFNGQGFQTVE